MDRAQEKEIMTMREGVGPIETRFWVLKVITGFGTRDTQHCGPLRPMRAHVNKESPKRKQENKQKDKRNGVQ